MSIYYRERLRGAFRLKIVGGIHGSSIQKRYCKLVKGMRGNVKTAAENTETENI